MTGNPLCEIPRELIRLSRYALAHVLNFSAVYIYVLPSISIYSSAILFSFLLQCPAYSQERRTRRITPNPHGFTLSPPYPATTRNRHRHAYISQSHLNYSSQRLVNTRVLAASQPVYHLLCTRCRRRCNSTTRQCLQRQLLHRPCWI